jgi:hypothetical protein
MYRHAVVALLSLACFNAIAQTPPTAQLSSLSDPTAVQLAQKALTALNVAGVQDVIVNGSVIWIFGSDYETGTGIFQANTLGQSRADLSLNGGVRSDVRTTSNGAPSGAWQLKGSTVNNYSTANCYADAAWFFPGLSSLLQTANTSFVLKYIGLAQHGGITTQHLQLFQLSTSAIQQHLTTIDVYLDPATFLPLAIAAPAHPDLDANTDIPSEIRFANYQSVNGVMVPFHVQRLLNGGVVTDITVTNVVFNTGLPSSTFILQ